MPFTKATTKYQYSRKPRTISDVVKISSYEVKGKQTLMTLTIGDRQRNALGWDVRQPTIAMVGTGTDTGWMMFSPDPDGKCLFSRSTRMAKQYRCHIARYFDPKKYEAFGSLPVDWKLQGRSIMVRLPEILVSAANTSEVSEAVRAAPTENLARVRQHVAF